MGNNPSKQSFKKTKKPSFKERFYGKHSDGGLMTLTKVLRRLPWDFHNRTAKTFYGIVYSKKYSLMKFILYNFRLINYNYFRQQIHNAGEEYRTLKYAYQHIPTSNISEETMANKKAAETMTFEKRSKETEMNDAMVIFYHLFQKVKEDEDEEPKSGGKDYQELYNKFLQQLENGNYNIRRFMEFLERVEYLGKSGRNGLKVPSSSNINDINGDFYNLPSDTDSFLKLVRNVKQDVTSYFKGDDIQKASEVVSTTRTKIPKSSSAYYLHQFPRNAQTKKSLKQKDWNASKTKSADSDEPDDRPPPPSTPPPSVPKFDDTDPLQIDDTVPTQIDDTASSKIPPPLPSTPAPSYGGKNKSRHRKKKTPRRYYRSRRYRRTRIYR